MKLKCPACGKFEWIDIIPVIIIVGMILVLSSIVFHACFNSWSEVRALKDQAVKRGHATYETDGRKIEFKWRD